MTSRAVSSVVSRSVPLGSSTVIFTTPWSMAPKKSMPAMGMVPRLSTNTKITVVTVFLRWRNAHFRPTSYFLLSLSSISSHLSKNARNLIFFQTMVFVSRFNSSAQAMGTKVRATMMEADKANTMV